MESTSGNPLKVTAVIPKFDGTNWEAFSVAIKATLRYNGTWHLIETYDWATQQTAAGDDRPTPAVAATPTPEEIKAQAAWEEKNN